LQSPFSEINEDFVLRGRFLTKFEIVRLAIPLYRYHVKKNNSTGTSVGAAHIDR